MVAVFSLSATAVLVIASDTDLATPLGLTYALVSVLAFAALTGPVVLLGMSAARFAFHYWRFVVRVPHNKTYPEEFVDYERRTGRKPELGR